MKLILTPRRHAVPMLLGERHKTPEEKSAEIAEGRRDMLQALMRLFPQVTIVGIEGTDRVIVDLPDSEPDLPSRIRAALDAATGPVPGQGPPEPVWRSDIQPTFEAVAEAHGVKEYRPTVFAIVRDEHGRILLVQSRFSAAEWMLVQGGIEEGESPIPALTRELREEIGVGPRRTRSKPPRFVGVADLDAEDGRTDKRGFTKGKRYFIYEVTYRGPAKLKLQDSELAGYEWVGPRLDDPRLLQLLSGVRHGKSMLLIGAIIRVLA